MAKRSKPMAAIIVAIANIVVALPCMCCMGFNAFGIAMMSGAPPAKGQAQPAANNPFAEMAEQAEFVAKEAPGYKAEQISYNLIAILISFVLIISAIGLLMGKPFGRILSLGACVLMIIVALANAAYTGLYVMPAQKKFADQQAAKGAAPPPKGTIEAGGILGIAILILIGAGYPAVAIGLLMTGPVREYYSGRGRAEDDYDDDRRDDWDERRRDDDPRRRDDDYNR